MTEKEILEAQDKESKASFGKDYFELNPFERALIRGTIEARRRENLQRA